MGFIWRFARPRPVPHFGRVRAGKPNRGWFRRRRDRETRERERERKKATESERESERKTARARERASWWNVGQRRRQKDRERDRAPERARERQRETERDRERQREREREREEPCPIPCAGRERERGTFSRFGFQGSPAVRFRCGSVLRGSVVAVPVLRFRLGSTAFLNSSLSAIGVYSVCENLIDP